MKTQERSIGVGGVFVTLVGLVIGISIYILPGSLAASAGPAVIVSYGLAALMALFGCVVAAQIGAIFPISGASFFAISSLLSPFVGFITVWFMIGAAAVATGLIAYGFADYFNALWPIVDRKILAFFIVILLGSLNLIGTKETVRWQTFMVISFMLALIIFGFVGSVNIDLQLLHPFMPNGWNSVFSAAVPAFFSYAGFMLIIEMSGEIKNPGRTLPLGLGISFVTVLLAYTVVSLVIVGVIPWSDLGTLSAPVGEVAHRIMPSWLAKFVIITAIAAAASSINALILGYSRDVFALAKVQILPKALAKISPKSTVPFNSILVMLFLSMIAIAFGGTISDLATLVVIGMLGLQLALGFSLLFIHKKLPHRYENASFKINPKLLVFFSVGLIIFSLLFLSIVMWGNFKIIIIAAAYLIIGALYFYFKIMASNKNKKLELLISEEIDNSLD
ncbi:MAG: amino acid permease [Pseudomonadota bacterium]